MEQIIDHGSPASEVNDGRSLSPDQVAAYLEGRLSGDELARVEQQLADNPSARRELISTSRILATAPKRSSRVRPFTLGATLIAASALLAVSINVRQKPLQPDSVVSSERPGAVDEATRVDLLSPVENARIGGTDLRLAWHAVEGATYRVVVSDSTGNTLLQKTTTDTVIGVPQTILTKGTHIYYWSVDALAPDGSSMTSGVREFTKTQR
ncbi:MAG TPA: hypothetical protein VM099_16755 [Gemmatimonadaceae bacterium]|nr:hypothetical protein [Gemmatimonadaceae bacterium]